MLLFFALKTVSVYIDCGTCDFDYIKSRLNYVNYVREVTTADIYINITFKQTGGGGKHFYILFEGRHLFKGQNNTIEFDVNSNATEDIIRKNLTHYLSLGLVPYLLKTSINKDLYLYYSPAKTIVKKEDKWKNWLLSVNTNTFANGVQSKTNLFLNLNLTVSRITKKDKIFISPYVNYHYVEYRINDTLTIKDTSTSIGAGGTYIQGINEHFSLYYRISDYNSSYSNIKNALSSKIGIEYSIFPYSKSIFHSINIRYLTAYSYNIYEDTTIYDRIKEHLFDEAVSLNTNIKKTWGNIFTSLYFSHYFHDIKKHRLTLSNSIYLKIFTGLSIRLQGNVSLIHDQLSIRKGEISPEDVILERKQLQTQYSYNLSIGLTYKFGSIYSNIVNPRFENSNYQYQFFN